MQQQLDKIEDDVQEILTALKGSSLTGKGGVIGRLDIVEEKLDKLEKANMKLQIYQKLLWSAAGVVTFEVLDQILKHLF